MSKLILTTDHSGSGSLKMSHIADKVYALTHRLVWGPAPAIVDGAAFLEARLVMSRQPGEDWAYWTEWDSAPNDEPADEDAIDATSLPEREVWSGLVGLCGGFDAVELWIGPVPNAQLILVQVLAWFAGYPEIVGKLSLVHPEGRLGERPPGDSATLRAVRHPVQDAHLKLAGEAWQAFTQPTPEAWLELLARDLSLLPCLRPTVLEMLQELPDACTGLGATENTMLALIAPGDVAPFDIFPGHLKRNDRRVFDYWEVGQMLNRLAQAPEPVILGLNEGPFNLAMHDAQERYARYRRSRLSLTDLGCRLVKGQDDILRHRLIHRWWGGTLLNREALWRWDAITDRLVAPRR